MGRMRKILKKFFEAPKDEKAGGGGMRIVTELLTERERDKGEKDPAIYLDFKI